MAIRMQEPDRPANVKILKFDQRDDVHVRRAAMYCHDISKQLRDIGIHFTTIIPIIKNTALMKKYKFNKNSKAMQLRIALTGIEIKDKQLIDDILSFFLTQEYYNVVAHGKEDATTYFFIINNTNPAKDEKELKEDLIDGQPK